MLKNFFFAIQPFYKFLHFRELRYNWQKLRRQPPLRKKQFISLLNILCMSYPDVGKNFPNIDIFVVKLTIIHEV